MITTPSCAQPWCAARAPGHVVHESPPVSLPGGADRVLFAETCPDTGRLLYGPVLGGGDADEPVGHARVLAARLRVAAARLDELAAAENGYGHGRDMRAPDTEAFSDSWM